MRKVIEWIVDHPWPMLGIVAVITIGFAISIPALTTLTDFKKYISEDDPAIAAMNRAEARYGSATFFMVAVEADDTVFKTSTLEKIKAMSTEFKAIIGVDKVTDPLNAQVITGTEKALVVGPAAPGEEVPRTPEAMEEYEQRVLESRLLRDYIIAADGKAAAISIKLKPDADRQAIARQVVEIVERYKNPERIYIVGLPYMSLILSESMGKDLRLMLPLVILVIITVLYLSFGSLRGVLLPLLVVSLSIIWTVGAMALFHIPFTVMSFILPVILMAIGVAYSIHVLNRYYEELGQGKPKREAVIETAVQMLSPVAMAGLTTMAGFLSFLTSFLIPLRQFGYFAAFGTCVAMILSLVLLPALLALLRLPKRRAQTDAGPLGKVFRGFEWLAARHRRAVLITSLAILIACTVGMSLVRVETSEKEFLGEDHPIVQALNVMDNHFSGSEQVVIEIDTGRRDGLKDPAMLERIVALEEWLKTKPGVKINKTLSLADLVREMNQKFHADDPNYYAIPDDRKLVAQLLLLFTFQGGDLGSMALGDFSAGEITGFYSAGSSSVEVQLSREIDNYLRQTFKDVRAEDVGSTKLGASLFSKILSSQIANLISSMIAAGLIVVLLMGSLLAGAISVIPLVLTVVINFGVMGFANMPLDMATLMVCPMAIGTGIDYAIHFMSRFRREFQASGDPELAARQTFRTSGRGIVYNALALILGFGVLLFSTFTGTTRFGLLIAVTVIISATSAFTIIPAILMTWQPRFLTRRAWSRKEVVLAKTGKVALNSNPGLNLKPNLTPTDKEVKDEGKI